MSNLEEKDFIQEGYSKDPSSFWVWLSLLAMVAMLLWGGQSWYYNWMQTHVIDSPFLQVSNRQLSVFLWQFPEKMRINAKQKTGYLTAFQDKISVDSALADQIAEAPPELLFLYHTWKRLLGDYIPKKAIPTVEFQEFLRSQQLWLPIFWPEASAGYVQLINGLESHPMNDLSALPLETLPKDVRLAFYGWKNFFKDREAINHVAPTYSEMKAFLEKYPNYSRNFWRNILLSELPKYLYNLSFEKYEADEKIPIDQLSGFLRAAYFNMAKEVM